MDLKEPFKLPSEGKIYDKNLTAEYTIRAPRLCDKGIGNLNKKNKIQSEVLKKCLEPTPEIDPYDWHTSDYTAANLAQRMAARGKMMKLVVKCPHCGNQEEIEVDLSEVKINPPKLPFDLKYTNADGDEIELKFFTPRLLDQIKDNTEKFKEDYPEATQDVGLQETVRALIISINGEKVPYSQMTNFILNSYEVDLFNIVEKAAGTNFGPELIQKRRCSNCGEIIHFTISPDRG